MLLVLVYPMGKGTAERPVPSLGPACSSSSQCHDLRVLGCAMEEGTCQWWDAEDGQSPSTHGLCELAGLSKKPAEISARAFHGEEKHVEKIWMGWKCHSSMFKYVHLSRWALENGLLDFFFYYYY